MYFVVHGPLLVPSFLNGLPFSPWLPFVASSLGNMIQLFRDLSPAFTGLADTVGETDGLVVYLAEGWMDEDWLSVVEPFTF